MDNLIDTTLVQQLIEVILYTITGILGGVLFVFAVGGFYDNDNNNTEGD